MKVTLGIVACLAVINAASVQQVNVTTGVDKTFLARQKFLLEIVYKVQKPLQFEELIKLGSHLVENKENYKVYDEFMAKFYGAYKVGGLLPKGQFFSALHKQHSIMRFGLFNYFYYAKDWETFTRNVAWARLNINEGIFVSALTLAVIHRPDMKGLILPPIYEIFPQMFFPGEFIQKANQFDWDVFNRQIMLEKELKSSYDQEYPNEAVGKRFNRMGLNVWEWWKQRGLKDDWQLEETVIFRNNIETFKDDPKNKAVLADIKSVWHPVDFTRDIEVFNAESKLSYFTEDLSWNAYWYYLNMDYSRILGKDFNLRKDRRGEWWIYNVQQLLARYYMERLSNGMGEVDEITYSGIIKTGYDPQLIAYNGQGYTYRKNYYELESRRNNDLLNKLTNIEQRVYDIIDSGKYVTKDGVVIDLTKPETIDHIGSLMHGHIDVLDRKFFGYWYSFAILYLGEAELEEVTTKPNVLFNFETMLRDPISYSLFKKVIDVFYRFKNHLPPYKREELIVPGVKIVDIVYNRLETYFDVVDTDVTNLLNEKMVFQDGKFIWDKTLLARQMRLNHKNFDYAMRVNSTNKVKVVIKTFMAPDFDEFGRKIDLVANRANFMKLDEFVHELHRGVNTILRLSKNFNVIKDFTTSTELYKYVMLAYEDKQEFPMEISQPHCGFPDRLILPRGWVHGMIMKTFTIIVPYTEEHKQFSAAENSYTCGIGSGIRHIDNLPFGYPFDRKIDDLSEFFVPNMFVKDVKIFHLDMYESFRPHNNKWENLRSFDINF